MGDNEETLEELFEKLAREREPLDFLSQFICPTLIGDIWEYIRKATLLLLATQNDINTTRIRLHTLLVGSPGTGKTLYLQWIQENLGGILISSEHTSKTGLVGDARGHRITPGLLADYDGNIVCLHPDNRVLFNNKFIKIKEIVDNGYVIGLDIPNLTTKEIKTDRIIKRRYNGKLYHIKLNSGYEIKVTADHKLLDGERLKWREAKNFTIGDYLVCPLRLPANYEKIYILDILSPEEKIILKKEDRKLLKKLLMNKFKNKRYKSEPNIWRHFKERYNINSRFLQQKVNNTIRVDDFKRILNDLNIYEEWRKKEYCISYKKWKIGEIKPELCYLLGFMVGDGTINKEKQPIIIQSIVHEKQIKKIMDCYKKVFGNYPHRYYYKKRINLIYFKKLFYIIYDYFTKNDFANIFQLNDNCLKSFFAGLIDSDGHISIKTSKKGKVIHIGLDLGLSQKQYQTLLIALKRFGCYGKVKKIKNNYSIIITTREDVKRLIDILKGASVKADEKQNIPIQKENKRGQRDIAPMEITKKLFQEIYENINTSILVQKNIASTFDGYRKGKRLPNKNIIKDSLQKIKIDDVVRNKLIRLCSTEYYLDKIIDIKITEYDGIVYDFVIPEYHNFMTEGVIVHNCPDELDKLPAHDQSGLLQAMEEGKYMIVKGKQRMEFDAEVRVIAGANQLDKIVKPLQDRFDFIFKLSVVKREKRAENVDKLIKAFFGTNEMDKSQLILEYLRWIKDFKPVIEEQDFEAISEMMAMYIRKTSTKIDNVSIRNLEMSILRIAYAMAKLEKSNIKPKHVKRAILFKNAVLKKLVGEREQ